MAHSHWRPRLLIAALHAWTLLDAVLAERDQTLVYNFLTRPELRAPKWNVTVYDHESLSPGYIFVAPYERIGQKTAGDGWIGPHIYTDNGELVWSGADMFGNMSVQDFRVSRVNGQDELSLIRPELRAGVLMDDHFQITQEIPVDGFNMHDFNFIDDGQHALVILRGVQNSSREDAASTGLETGLCSANFHGIAEFDVNTWQPTWNWSSWGHIGLNESKLANGRAAARCSHEWDYLHANAVDKCPDGDILMSGRHTDAIYKISRTTGDIVWRLGGLMNDFTMIDGLNFSRQHDVRCRAQNETATIITILDNAKGEDPQRATSEFSRGLRIAVNNETMEASLIQHFDHPSGNRSYAWRRGTYQQLPNDHVIMGWSEHSHFSEHSPDGRMLMQAAMLPEWVGTYRSYKFEFVGRPLDPPDIFAQAFDKSENSTITAVYVSWNGATEVDSYSFYESVDNGNRAVLISATKKTGFETSIVHDGYAGYTFVEALDSSGEVIGRSKVFKTLDPPQPVTEAIETATTIAHSTKVQVAMAAFALGVLLAVIGFLTRRRWLPGFTIFNMKLPWHQEQRYHRLDEESGNPDSTMTTTTTTTKTTVADY